MTLFRPARSGNALVLILMAVVLFAALTAAITRSNSGGTTINTEQTQIRAANMVSFAIDLRRAVENVIRAGKSETALSFASASLANYGTPDTAPANEVFHINGGGVAYVDVPANVNDGSGWEFYSFTAAPGVGNDTEPDLMLVLPNVTEMFCTAYNKKAGFPESAAIPTDSAACLHDTGKRFAGTFASGGDINTLDTGTFPTANKPYPAACVACGSNYNAYYVLLER